MYGKLFVQMYDGTLATKGPWQALVTFQQLVILSDKTGTVDMTAEAISRRTTIPIEIITIGLAELLKPDEQSRSPEMNGKRIVPVTEGREWGWKIVNYDHYRKIRSEEERREYHRDYMRRKRSSVNQNVKVSTGRDQCQPIAVSSKHKSIGAKNALESFEVSEQMSQWASQQGLNPDAVMPETTKFFDHHIAKASKFADWDAAWRNWIRNAVKFAKA